MAVLSPVAKQQFFDAGVPAAGYLLYTYAANTTTPLATYSNRAGTVANANPIVLDSEGRATIYLPQDQRFDYVLKTVDGAPVWTQEDVEAGVSGADLAAPTGAALVGIKRAGMGAEERTLDRKVLERFSLFDFMTEAEQDDALSGAPVLDHSAAWAAAIAAANTVRAAAMTGGLPVSAAVLEIPACDLNILTGTTVSTLNVEIVGAGRSATRIQIGSGQYLLTATARINQGGISGLSTEGGKGVLRHEYMGNNVQGRFVAFDNYFNNYTECALGSLSEDFPYLCTEGNVFKGTDALTSIGVAFAGYTDNCIIEKNAFLRNRYHVKLGRGGNNAKLHDNDFIRFTSGGGAPALVDVWVVPEATFTNSGAGLVCDKNKFGNENQDVGDMCVLYADEAAGGDFMTNAHSTAESVGYVSGHMFSKNLVNGVSGRTRGFITSFTERVSNIEVDNFWIGGKPAYVIEYDAAVTHTGNRAYAGHPIDYTKVYDGSEAQQPPWSNRPSTGLVNDPFGYLAGYPEHINAFQAGHDGGYTSLNAAALRASGLSLGVATTRSLIEDAIGGDNAAELTFTAAAGAGAVAYGSSAPPTIGRRAWIELDVKKSATNPVTAIQLDVYLGAFVQPVLRRVIYLPDGWETVRFAHVPHAAGNYSIQVKPYDYAEGTKNRLRFGRIRVYHAAEPIHPGAIHKQATATWAIGLIASGATAQKTVPLTGAALGDLAVASVGVSLAGMTLAAEARTNEVVATITNNTGAGITLGSATLAVRVFKQ